MSLLEKMSVEQLQSEASNVRLADPEKAAVVYGHLIDRVEDFSEKLRYQRMAARFERSSKTPIRAKA
jgi:hypothetical protein